MSDEDTDAGESLTFPPEVTRIANLLAEHRAVPFLGAGCSVAHLGVDWSGLMERLLGEEARELDVLHAASAFVERNGRASFMDALRSELLIAAFDDEKGSLHLHVMGLAMGAVYTTNQDNVFEKCFEKYGRSINVVAQLTDFAKQEPFLPTLYKYHGDLSLPESVVFTSEDYQARMDRRDDPLDVRLRSDCLSKSLIFIGFSFTDPNVRNFFKHLGDVFGGRLPPSFLVQYAPDEAFARSLKEEFGLEVIDTAGIYPELTDHTARLDRFMRDVNEGVLGHRRGLEIASLFETRRDSGTRTIATGEIDSLGRALPGMEFSEGVDAFRMAYDQVLIPQARQAVVASQLSELARRASQPADYEAVKAALFNLPLQQVEACFAAWAACCAAANVCVTESFLSLAAPMPAAMDIAHDEMLVVATAIAFTLLEETWGRRPSKVFYAAVSYWENSFPHPDDLPEKMRDGLQQTFDYFYAQGKTTYEHPFKSARRVGRRRRDDASTFAAIRDRLEGVMPKRRLTPPNDG